MNNPTGTKHIGFRTILALAGAVILYQGIDNAVGGVASAGLQGPTDFFSVTDPIAFETRDSHVRFLGGLWLGVGLIFLAASVKLRALREGVTTVCFLAFVGGLSRAFSMSFDELADHHLLGALVAELTVLPTLGWTAWRIGHGYTRRGGALQNVAVRGGAGP